MGWTEFQEPWAPKAFKGPREFKAPWDHRGQREQVAEEALQRSTT